jgi:hypothetical protein
MSDEDFERTLDEWADHQIESAPEIRPTEEMYSLVRARGQGKPWSLASSKPAMVAMALASLALIVVLYALLIRPATLPGMPPDQEIAYVGQREGAAGKGVVVHEPVVPKGRGPKKESIFFNRLWFQFQEQGSQAVESVDLQLPQEGRVTLTSADNYRLLIEPSEGTHVYLFQLSPDNHLARLFPNEVYAPAQNPLSPGETLHLPAAPNWLYLGDGRGEERLYVVASAQPIGNLERLYAQYSQADDDTKRQRLLSSLLDMLETGADTSPEEAAGWVFIIGHQ